MCCLFQGRQVKESSRSWLPAKPAGRDARERKRSPIPSPWTLCCRLWQVHITAVIWRGFLEAGFLSCFPLIFSLLPLALWGVVRIPPALGGPRWTLRHQLVPSQLLLPDLLSVLAEQAGKPWLALPSPYEPPTLAPGTAMQWVPASLTSHGTHSHVGSWPVFLVRAEWRPEEAFSVSCGEVSFSAGPKSRQSLGIIRWG